MYLKLLAKTEDALKVISAVIAYNVIATEDWMLLIPRTHQSHDGLAPTNGAGMMGLVWVADQTERDDWTRMGMSNHLAYLGIAS
jgi:ATP adenylyltransferase